MSSVHSTITDETKNRFLHACTTGDMDGLKEFWSRRTRPKNFDRHMHHNLCLVKAVAQRPDNLEVVTRLLKWGIPTKSRDYYAVQIVARRILNAPSIEEREAWFEIMKVLLTKDVRALRAGNCLVLRVLIRMGWVHRLAELPEGFETPDLVIPPSLASYALAYAMKHAHDSEEHGAWLSALRARFPVATLDNLQSERLRAEATSAFLDLPCE